LVKLTRPDQIMELRRKSLAFPQQLGHATFAERGTNLYHRTSRDCDRGTGVLRQSDDRLE